MTTEREKLLRDPNLHLIFGITLVAVMGVAVLAPAFPKIVNELGISTRQVGLLITVFTLPGVFLTPVLGVLADRLGRKRILVPALLLFGLAGGMCTFVRHFHLLLLLRFFQGVGAASLGSLNVTIIGDLYEGRLRAKALGYNASVLSLGTASYPAIGGGLAMLGWYYPFALSFLAIPLGLFVLYRLNNPEPKSEEVLLAYMRSAWRSVRHIRVAGLFAAGLITFIILYGSYLTFFPLLLGHSFGAPPYLIGLIMSSMSLTTALTASQAGRLARGFKKRSLLQISFSLYTLSLLIIPQVQALWLFLLPAVLFGAAQGINIPAVQTMLTEQAPAKYRAAFMSLYGLILRLGQTCGPLIMGGAFHFWQMKGAFYAGAGFALAAILIMSLTIKELPNPLDAN